MEGVDGFSVWYIAQCTCMVQVMGARSSVSGDAVDIM